MSVSVCLRYLPLARYIRCNRLSILLCDLVLERIEKWKREEQMWKKNDSVKKIQEKYLQRAKRRWEICEKQNIGRRRKARVELEEKRLESTGKENVNMTDSWKKFVRGKVRGGAVCQTADLPSCSSIRHFSHWVWNASFNLGTDSYFLKSSFHSCLANINELPIDFHMLDSLGWDFSSH